MSLTGSIKLQPSAEQQLMATNYLTSSDFDFTKPYMPELYNEEVLQYGDQSIASYLRKVGAQIPFTSDLIKWSEEGRLHTKYINCASDGAATDDTATITVSDTLDPGEGSIAIRKNQIVFIYNNDRSGEGNKAFVSAVDTSAGTFDVAYYEGVGQAFAATDTLSVYVLSSEFGKGTSGMENSLQSKTDIKEAFPSIAKDKYEINASDMGQIGWIEVDDLEGMSGYFWYLKSKGDFSRRFEDQIEMKGLEGIPAETGSGAIALGLRGSEGFFYTVENNGNVFGSGYPDTLAEFDTINNRLDKQGAIDSYTIHAKRNFQTAISDMMAELGGTATVGTALPYGLFNNESDMKLELNFTGFNRSGYNYYVSPWKYLNDASTRGDVAGSGLGVNGIFSPVGEKSVYDNIEGRTVTRPMIHHRYRKNDKQDRRKHSWVTGGVVGTNEVDGMTINVVSEMALCVLGANNFLICKD